ncbi:hypothetical protein [Peribacillus sp. SI8-4]|nr:hypothetical protein [Peribacillus sp. SI8-4]
MKPKNNEQPFKFFKKANDSKPTERKQMSDFIKRMKMNGHDSHLNGKNS